MLSTGVMIKTGAVYGNLMVNVQPTNAKLVDRAQRIIAAATGVDQATAAKLLARSRHCKNSHRYAEALARPLSRRSKLKAAKGSLATVLQPMRNPADSQ